MANTWMASTVVDAAPEEVLDVLTDPELIRCWAPIDFELETLTDDRLRAGTEARVGGCLAGHRVAFSVSVDEAGEDALAVTADGPLVIRAAYAIAATDGGSEVTARISLRGEGVTGRLLARATGALLTAGGLEAVVGRIAQTAEAADSGRTLALAA